MLKIVLIVSVSLDGNLVAHLCRVESLRYFLGLPHVLRSIIIIRLRVLSDLCNLWGHSVCKHVGVDLRVSSLLHVRSSRVLTCVGGLVAKYVLIHVGVSLLVHHCCHGCLISKLFVQSLLVSTGHAQVWVLLSSVPCSHFDSAAHVDEFEVTASVRADVAVLVDGGAKFNALREGVLDCLIHKIYWKLYLKFLIVIFKIRQLIKII